MAGLSDYMGGGGWGPSSDDLIRAAQSGSLPAYKELIRRGEMIPPPAREQGRHGRPSGPGVDRGAEGLRLNFMSAINQRPSSAVPGMDNITTDLPYLSAANAPGMQSPPGMDNITTSLPMMGAINPQQPEAPDYLGTGMMGGQQGGVAPGAPSPQQRLSKIANGGDIAGSIQAGAQAASETAGEAPAAAMQGPLGPLAEAMASLEDHPDDKYGGSIDEIIQSLMKGHDPAANRNMALAQAGFAMAASGSPTFFGAVGQGGLAGLSAYKEQERQDMIDRVNAARLAQGQQEYTAEQERTKFGQKLDIAKQTEVEQENKRQQGRFERSQTEQERHDRAAERDNALTRSLQARGYDLEAERLEQARVQYERTQALVEKNAATDADLRKAQTELTKAQTEANKALGIGRTQKLVPGTTGTFIYDSSTGTTTEIKTPDGKPIVTKSSSANSWGAKEAAMQAGGYSPQDIADVAAGKKVISESEAIQRATAAAAAKSRNELDPNQAQIVYEDEYQRIYDALMDNLARPGAPAAATPSAAPPAGNTAPGSDTPPVQGARKAPDGNWYVPDPNRPGKYLKVE